MNDFTKEELNYLYELLDDAIHDFNEPDSTYELRYKIQCIMDGHSEQECTPILPHMTFKTIYEPEKLTFENFHDVCSKASGIYKCIKCESNDIDKIFIIKYGLHEWFLCKKCSSKFMYLVRNNNVLEEVPEGYGHWSMTLIKNHKCNHESDGMIYTSNPPKQKCIKCKEFYNE